MSAKCPAQSQIIDLGSSAFTASVQPQLMVTVHLDSQIEPIFGIIFGLILLNTIASLWAIAWSYRIIRMSSK
jgi:hypothetical protein